MSRFLNRRSIAAAVCVSASLFAGWAAAEKLGLGRPATEAEVKAWDIDIRPDGKGLPPGKGSVATGEELYGKLCASCHGDFGEGVDRWPVLAGGKDTLKSEDPVKTIGSYWPYTSTIWDYVHRSMPFGAAQSLSDDDVYAITAYLLYLNDLVDEDFVLSDKNFTTIELPNKKNFKLDDRPDSPIFKKRDPCMKDCKESVKVTGRARVLDVTPDSGATKDDAKAPAPTAAADAKKDAPKADAKVADKPTAAPKAAAIDMELAKRGEKLFRQCTACHDAGKGAKNKVGPALAKIMGSPLASVPGFKYSKVFKAKAAEGAVWDSATMDAFLKKPMSWARGTMMAFGGVRKAEDRQALIEYLKLVAPGEPGAKKAAAPKEAAVVAIDAALAERGKKVFRACKACHAVGKGAKNKVGPGLYKVLGAPIGSVAGFRYSKTFKKKAAAGEVWDAASLDAFMAKPLAWAKGTYMAFGGVRKASDRKALIEYLKSVGQE